MKFHQISLSIFIDEVGLYCWTRLSIQRSFYAFIINNSQIIIPSIAIKPDYLFHFIADRYVIHYETYSFSLPYQHMEMLASLPPRKVLEKMRRNHKDLLLLSQQN